MFGGPSDDKDALYNEAKKAIVKIAWKSNGVNRAVVLVKEFYDWKSL